MTQEPRGEGGPSTQPDNARAADLSEVHPPAALKSLRQAMRRARFDDAERIGVLADLRTASVGRLGLLEEALQPLLDQIPADVDLFDVALVPGANPRLFIDMIGFVEMGRDAHSYRLLQTNRHGRKLIAETDKIERMVESITDYVARRLLERDKALAGDSEDIAGGRNAGETSRQPDATPGASSAAPRRAWEILGAVFAFVIDVLGSIALTTIVLAILFYALTFVWPRIIG